MPKRRRRTNPAAMRRKMQRVRRFREIAFVCNLYHGLIGKDFAYVPAISHKLKAMKEAALAMLDSLLPDVPVLIPPEELTIKDASVDRSAPSGRFMILQL
jgi:hypothetical protein